jgi:small-conductance mechanosensitive channel
MTASRLFSAAVLAALLLLLPACEMPSTWTGSADSTAADTSLAGAASADSVAVDTSAVSPLAAADTAGPDTTGPDVSAAESPSIAETGTAAPTTDAGTTGAAAQADAQEAGTAERDTSATADDDRPTLDDVRSYGFRFAMAMLVFLAAFFTIKGVVYVLEALAERSAERRLLYKRIIPIARILLWALALFIVLKGIFSVDARSLLAAATAIGVAVGFAAQDILKNIFGGLVIIFDQPFQAGDKISVGGTYGEVISIGLRSTRIVTPDDNLVSVPNAQVVDGQVSNANAGALDCQVVTDLYLPGWADEQRAKQIAYQAAASSAYTYLEKPIAVIVKDEYDDGHMLHLKVKAYVLDARFEFLLASDVTERARRVFREEGLLLPAPRAYVDLAAT